ncbi:YeaH/YhbH family protein [Oceaniserpentilla sp. 4NH20-0058]|uniref:YeaH/YhbH family protein n=1 Tax=Oceaniserpentilla sp. 4NH20-0058 TaxID=3127660 RepID=UPI0031099E8A
MSYIIDRRLNGKNKSMVNRQRFLRRYKSHIKKAVTDAVNKRSITDMERGEKISIPTRDTSEPVFGHGSGGARQRVLPGNREFNAGDKVLRPKGQGGGGGAGEGNASNQGEGDDDFSFFISKDEFLDYVFEDLALPNLIKKTLNEHDAVEYRRAGFTATGTPNNLAVVKSMRAAQARRIALSASSRRKLKKAKAELEEECAKDNDLKNPIKIKELEEVILKLEEKIKKIPFIDTFDIKYRNVLKEPVPSTKAVMFCVMDVSGSMTQQIKDMAKRFYILLYLFLQRNYEKTEVVFIRHHTSAKEVDEQEFFYSRETGGTIVSSALELMANIIEERYNPAEWNIYGAQASDGDNWDDDSPQCAEILHQRIMPMSQYFAYIEITPNAHQALWRAYEDLAPQLGDRFAMEQITSAEDIFPVFRDLFSRKSLKEAV